MDSVGAVRVVFTVRACGCTGASQWEKADGGKQQNRVKFFHFKIKYVAFLRLNY